MARSARLLTFLLAGSALTLAGGAAAQELTPPPTGSPRQSTAAST